ncbi:MAG: ribulose-phosphate 3-epimerase [Methanomassiliicoccales archaeon]|nr:ribulose-phosphate 3-epimerase [Methanomassiliicoccales archaeon]
MIKIAPSILSADFGRLGSEVEKLEGSGADWVHVDVMDGAFVPNITIGPCVIKSIRPFSKLPFDVHLMIMNPEKFIDAFVDAGSDIITIHLEATKNVRGTLQRIRERGKRAGLSINPSTPFSEIVPYIPDLDVLLIMTVTPGFGGQPFMADCLSKIREARDYVDAKAPTIDIEVDGGINFDTGRRCVEAGANVLAAGNALFGSKDMRSEIARWKRT